MKTFLLDDSFVVLSCSSDMIVSDFKRKKNISAFLNRTFLFAQNVNKLYTDSYSIKSLWIINLFVVLLVDLSSSYFVLGAIQILSHTFWTILDYSKST